MTSIAHSIQQQVTGYSYSSDVASPEVEIAGEGAGSFFADMKSRHADLTAMLDGSKDQLKLEAMRRIITLIAKGKDASDLFPAVVKNVATKNHELKKLVYVYLVRYAEDQQDLALLSISTFQRALKDPNQLIRASALRVLSSVRVEMIVPIMMLAIKDSVRDMSPYVRRTAAHAIPKLFILDPETKDELIEVIDMLLGDKTTLVVGSTVYAFEEVCPDRLDLVHAHYRKLCRLVIDIDEWGQISIINMLTRYARTFFVDPNKADGDCVETAESSGSDDERSSSEEDNNRRRIGSLSAKDTVDPDLRLLLRNTKPLLQSRNAAVVMAVAQLYYHCAPSSDVGIIARSLVRLLRSHREVQSVVLVNIATIAAVAPSTPVYAISKNMFEPFLKSFFVRSSDPMHIKLLKLDILTNLATQTNINMILREFHTYVSTHDKEFAAATVDAIGRCAANINEVTDVCLSGLVHLLANRNETVVAQSVVVIKRLMQLPSTEAQQVCDIIKSMTRLLHRITVPAARASILWLLGENCERVPTLAPDALRMAAKGFSDEEEPVKMQIVNFAAKLYLTQKPKVELLVQYVFQMARYDQSYDLRDRARFLRAMIMPKEPNVITEMSKDIFLVQKPAPVIESKFKARTSFHLSTLSHYFDYRLSQYLPLPEWCTEPTDATLRNTTAYPTPDSVPSAAATSMSMTTSAVTTPHADSIGSMTPMSHVPKQTTQSLDQFFSEVNEASSEEDEDDESEEEESEEESSEEESSEASSSGEESSDEAEVAPPPPPKPKAKSQKPAKPAKSTQPAVDLLLDFDSEPVSAPTMPVATISTTMAPRTSKPVVTRLDAVGEVTPAQYIPKDAVELLSKAAGLCVRARFSRSPNLCSSSAVSIELEFENKSDAPIEAICIDSHDDSSPVEVHALDALSPVVRNLAPGARQTAVIAATFGEAATQLARFALMVDGKQRFALEISAPAGEQIQPLLLQESEFTMIQNRLSGMNETSGQVGNVMGEPEMIARIYELANVVQTQVAEPKGTLFFAGQTLYGKSPVLIRVQSKEHETKLTINCEKMVIGSMLFKQLKLSLS